MFYLEITEQDLELMRKIKLPKNKLIRYKKKLKKFNNQSNRLIKDIKIYLLNYSLSENLDYNRFDKLTKKCSKLTNDSILLSPRYYFEETVKESVKTCNGEYSYKFILETKTEKENQKKIKNAKIIQEYHKLLLDECME